MGFARWFRGLRRGAKRGALNAKSAARWSLKRPRGKKVRGKPAAGKNRLASDRKSAIGHKPFTKNKSTPVRASRLRRAGRGITSLKKRGMMRGQSRKCNV